MPSRVFVILPVYNEEGSLKAVLSGIESLGEFVDGLVIVDDGSSDGSGCIIDEWVRGRPGATCLRHDRNQGYSQALLTGFNHLVARLDAGAASDRDIVVTIDADGQHDPSELPRMVQSMEAQDYDVVWGQRDLSVYPMWKRLGNRVMSLIARLFSGYPFKDVESGYCLFRLGPLATTLSYRTRDWRYSISLSLAVIFTRLGFRLSNEPKVSIPVYRSRTRMADVLVDTWAAANAWMAITFSPLCSSWEGRVRLGIGLSAVMAMTAIGSIVATKEIFLGHDSINNYVHVWFISESIYKSHALSMKIPWLENGQALTYPYGFLPWTLAALFYPAVGDYAVTWTMLLGVVLMLLVICKTQLRSEPWIFILVLLNPLLLEGSLSFQMAFFWGSIFAYLHIDAAKRGRKWQALLWWIVAIGTHPLIMGSVLAIYVAFAWFLSKERRKLLVWVVISSLPVLLPVAWYTMQTPSVNDYNVLFLVLTVLATVAPRACLFFAPFILLKLKNVLSGRLVGVYGALFLIAVSASVNIPFGDLAGLDANADNPYNEFLSSDSFERGAVFRVMEQSRREQGQYFFVKQGAVLANELFAESQHRVSFGRAQYRCFLAAKSIDYVVINQEYSKINHTNEEKLLEGLVNDEVSHLTHVDPKGRFEVFDVRDARQDTGMTARECFERYSS